MGCTKEKIAELEEAEARQCAVDPRVMRSPLAIGNRYQYPGYPQNGFVVTAMSLPSTSSDDGGLPGVAVRWLHPAGGSFWYPFETEAEFWAHLLFFNAIDA